MDVALFQANEVKQWLVRQKGVERIEIVDDLRRGKELVRAVEVLASTHDAAEILRSFAGSPLVREVVVRGAIWVEVFSTLGLPVTLHVVKPEKFGATLLNLTGSKDHLNQLEELAGHRDLRFDRFLAQAGLTEDDIYQQLGLPPIPPELREASGEVEAALVGKLPALITAHQLRGDLHMHTNWADGLDSIASMADAARARGYHYIGICDHSPLIEEANGLDQIKLRAQAEEIERLNQRYSDFVILRGLEVDIKANGELDLPDESLLDLDLVIASIHFPYDQDVETITKRLIAAMEHPLVDIIGHPTGRLLKRPDLYLPNVDELIKAAARTGTALEINSGPDRLDLDDYWAHQARESGVSLVIGSDAHSVVQLDWIQFGLATARRAWLEGVDIMNTLPLAELRKRLKRYWALSR
jgi:DNA polymerase (family 10)